jgi:hypothetical protein
MPRPGTDGRSSAGGDTRLESPEANSGVTGSGVEMPETAPSVVPGIGGADGGMTLATDEAAFCVVPLIAVLVIGAVAV